MKHDSSLQLSSKGVDDSPIIKTQNNQNSKVQLFLLHSAGGSTNNYRELITKFSPSFEIILIELSGRGTRCGGELPSTWEEVIEDIAYPIYKHINKPFAVFGHSMGSHIAFRLLSYLEAKFGLYPLCFFSSGSSSPHNISKHGFNSQPKDTFFELFYDIVNYGGIPKSLMKEEEIVHYIVELYRSDLKICNSLKDTEVPVLSCPIITINGNNDECLSTKSIEEWKKVTTNIFESHTIPGRHFYFYGKERQLANFISYKCNYFYKRSIAAA